MRFLKSIFDLHKLAIMIIVNLGITLILVAIFYSSTASLKSLLVFNSIKTFSIGTSCYFALQVIDHVFRKYKYLKWVLAFFAIIIATIMGNTFSNLIINSISGRNVSVVFDPYFYPIIGMSLIFGIFIYMFFLILHSYLDKKIENESIKKLQVQAELNELKYRINPHFLFNTMNSIASLIHDKPDAAEKMVTDLSDLLRYSISKNNNDLIKIESEIEIAKMYLEIEKIRLGNRLNVKFIIDENVNFLFPQAIILTLIENSVKHGISNIVKGGNITLEISNINGILIEVKNDFPRKDNKIIENFGLKYVRKVLEHNYGENHKLDISQDDQFVVRIEIDNN